MKKIFILLLILIVCKNNSNAQVVQLNEGFTSPFNFAGNGWFIQNNSVPLGSTMWTSGAGTVFAAYSGGSNDCASANFLNQGPTAGGISDFLVTPTVTLMNGGVLQYVTRTQSAPAQFADRMQVLESFGTGTGSIGSGTLAVGTFTGLINDINPNLTSTGYPGTWTVYSHTLSGITGTITGRFAFRYFVNNGGQSGANSNFIGLDDVKYTTGVNCVAPVLTITPSSTTICGSGGVTLFASGATNYSWSTGSTFASVFVTPTVSTTYSVIGNNNLPNCNGTATININVINQPTLTASNATACPGGTVNLTASGANTYSWSNGGSGSSILITATGPLTTVVVTGYNAPNCFNSATVSVSTNTFLTVPNTSITACPGLATVIGASGATSYNWSTGANTPSIVVTPTANVSYVVTGNSGGCSESKVINIIIDPNMFVPNFTTCAGTAATLIATGANSYSWSTGSTGSMVVVSPTANTVYTVVGTSGSCNQTRTVSVTHGLNLSVIASQFCIGTSVLLTAYGASSYTWYPINDHNSSVILTPTALTVYTLSGVSGTCSGTSTFQVSYCSGVEEVQFSNDPVKVYPNPFGDELNISNAYGNVQVINILGKVILTTSIEESVVIHTDAFERGIYFIIITNPGNTERKVIKVFRN